MRRKFMLPVLPPVARITAFFARIATLGWVVSILPLDRKLFNGVVWPGMILGVYCAVMPITLPAFCPEEGSRIRLAILYLSKNRTPFARALASSGLMRPVPALAFGLSGPAPLVQIA